MLKNYFKTAIRNLLRYKTVTAINVIGLSIGLAASLIIIFFVIKELSYDNHNEKLNDIYVIAGRSVKYGFTGYSAPSALIPAIKEELPEVMNAARMSGLKTTIKVDDKVFTEDMCRYVDPEILDILTLPLKYGQKECVLKNDNSVVVSEKIALKYFGNKNPIGEVISAATQSGTKDVTVTGVMKDIPDESTFKADLLFPLTLLGDYQIASMGSWNQQAIIVYVLTNPNVEINRINEKLDLITKKHTDENIYSFVPLKDIYLKSAGIMKNTFPSGSIANIYIYSSVAALILLLACINYIILSTGTANLRTREIGIRKVMGGTRTNIIIQIMTESLLITFLSVPIAMLFIEFMLPCVSGLLGKELTAGYFHNIQYVVLLCVISVVVGIISGSYLSIILSRHNPIDIIRNKFTSGKKRVVFRRILVGFQMFIFIGLIFTSQIVYKQLRYLYNKDFGFNKDGLLILNSDFTVMRNGFDAFKNTLKNNPDIISVSGAILMPGSGGRGITSFPNKNNPKEMLKIEESLVDGDFVKTMKMEIIAGRDFTSENPKGTGNQVLLNETAVKMLGFKNPVGETIMGLEIIGVVKDFNFHSLHEVIPPMMLRRGHKYINEIVVKINTADMPCTIQFIKEKSREFNNGKIMECEFFDERIAPFYVNDEKFGKVIAFFTGLSIFVAGLGLFGMSLFVIQQRIKEISMRKVLGASYWNIMMLVSREYLLLIIFACVITIPVAMYFISGWMARFAYKTEIDVTMIFITALLGLIITILTTGVKVFEAARINPVVNLKQE